MILFGQCIIRFNTHRALFITALYLNIDTCLLHMLSGQ